MAASAPRSPVLELSTINEGIPILIDGKPYEIRHPASFSLGELRRIDKMTSRSSVLELKDERTPDEEAQYSADLQALTDLILDAPAEVKGMLGDVQRLAVLNVFTRPRTTTATTTTTGAATSPASQKASAKPSRGSRGSTAARSTSGTGARRKP